MEDKKVPMICFPWGGAGNHIRWLMTIDETITHSFGNIEFIKTNVYNNERSWNNWITIEFLYRKQLDDTIRILHHIIQPKKHDEHLDLLHDTKILFLKINKVELAVNHYFHINLGMNGLKPIRLTESINDWNGTLDKIIQQNDNPNWLVLDSDCIYNKQLDYDFYKTIVDFYGLSDNYADAVQIHELYYQAKIKSARDFYEFFTSNEFAYYLEYTKIFSNED